MLAPLSTRLKPLTVPIAIAALVALSFSIGLFIGSTQGASRSLEELRADVYMEAWGAGYAAGFREGNATGFEDGFRAGRLQGYREGYAKGLEDGAGRGITLRDPSSFEVEVFLRRDATDELRHGPEGYTPLDLAAKLKASAMSSGLRCGLVVMVLDSGLAIVNCFNTTDRGLIYVEPWSDRTFTVKPGEHYGPSKVLKITIVW